MESQPIRIGLVGAGRVVRQHLEALAAVPLLRPVAIADPRVDAARAVGHQFGLAVFESAAELLESELDAVDILVPHNLHFPLAARALSAGKHVIMDKPLATSVADGRKLVELSDQTSRVLCVIHNLLFHPAVERARQLVLTGLLGQPTTAHAWSRGWLDVAPWDFRMSANKTGGGAWVDNGPHLLYVLQALLGPIDRCTVFANKTPSRLEAEDSVSAVASFADGPTATIRISYAEAVEPTATPWPDGWSQGVEVAGHTGWIRLEVTPRGRVRWRTGDGSTVTEQFDQPFSASFAGAFDDFVNAITTGSPLRVSASQSLSLLELTLTGSVSGTRQKGARHVADSGRA